MKTSYLNLVGKYFNLIPSLLISFSVGFIGISLADNIMVGRLGTVYLSGASISNSICSVFFLFSIGVSVGMTPIFSAAISRKNYYKLTKIFKHGILINLIIGCVLYLVLLVIIFNIDKLKQPTQVINIAKPYINIIALTLVPNSIKDIIVRYLVGIGKPKVSMYTSIIVFFSNVILNYIFIYGNLGAPRMLLIGAGIATFLSRIIEVVLLILYLFYFSKKNKYMLKIKDAKYSMQYFYKLFSICVPSGLQLAFEKGFTSVLNILVGWCGVYQQAAHAISVNIIQTILVFPLSVAVSSSIIVGMYMGKKDFHMIKKSGIVAYLICILFFAFICFVLILNKGTIVRWYNPVNEVYENVSKIFYLVLLFQIMNGANIIGVNLLKGMQDNLLPVVITVSSHWLLGLPISYFMAFKLNFKLNGLWIGSIFGFFMSAFILHLRFLYSTNNKQIQKINI